MGLLLLYGTLALFIGMPAVLFLIKKGLDYIFP